MYIAEAYIMSSPKGGYAMLLAAKAPLRGFAQSDVTNARDQPIS